jgi:hypothetical protein
MRLRLAVLTLFGSLAFAGAAHSADASGCLNGLRPALLAGGFTGSVDCHEDRLSVRHIGRVQSFGRTFQVYDYRYRLKPVCPDCAVHGGQRIIFIERGRYVGQYKPDFVHVTTRQGNLVLVPTGSGTPVTVRFTPEGPPNELWVGGEVISFFR